MEHLDLYDENGVRTGASIVRGTPVPRGACLLLVGIMTQRRDGMILMTRRASAKKYAGRWEITGGCVQSGESAGQGALRELREETGIHAEAGELISCGTYRRSDYIYAFFRVQKEINDADIRLQAGETDAFRWVTPDELLTLAESDQTIPHHTPMILHAYSEVFKDCERIRSAL